MLALLEGGDQHSVKTRVQTASLGKLSAVCGDYRSVAGVGLTNGIEEKFA